MRIAPAAPDPVTGYHESGTSDLTRLRSSFFMIYACFTWTLYQPGPLACICQVPPAAGVSDIIPEGLAHCELVSFSPSTALVMRIPGWPLFRCPRLLFQAFPHPSPNEPSHVPCPLFCLCLWTFAQIRIPFLSSGTRLKHCPPPPAWRGRNVPAPSDSSVFCLASWILTSLLSVPWPCHPSVGCFPSDSSLTSSRSLVFHLHADTYGHMVYCGPAGRAGVERLLGSPEVLLGPCDLGREPRQDREDLTGPHHP